jgi:hypothetical protein
MRRIALLFAVRLRAAGLLSAFFGILLAGAARADNLSRK